MSKRALITGITGQDGSYLSELLLSKGYEVHGIIRRSSSFNTARIDHIFDRLTLHHGDVTDAGCISRIVAEVQPDEVYNLAAQSHVAVSFQQPEYTTQSVYIGTLNVLEAVRSHCKTARVYQASSSEMFGNSPAPQNENTPFDPQSPYAVAKVAAHNLAKLYRNSYGLFIACGILFNHESPRRGETFVTRKIAKGVAAVAAGRQSCIRLGNLDARRDWGYAPEYVEAMWLMLQQDVPEDFVIGTGETHSVRDYVLEAFRIAVPPSQNPWTREPAGEEWYRSCIKVDARYFRPAEVNVLQADASKARFVLGWSPRVKFPQLVRLMVEAEMAPPPIRYRRSSDVKCTYSPPWEELPALGLPVSPEVRP